MKTFPKNKQHRSRYFLKWAKEQGGLCCICLGVSGHEVASCELHHYGEKGMGQKGSDFRVARLCQMHHEKYQGRRKLSFFRSNLINVLEAFEADNIDLLEAYAIMLEKRNV